MSQSAAGAFSALWWTLAVMIIALYYWCGKLRDRIEKLERDAEQRGEKQ